MATKKKSPKIVKKKKAAAKLKPVRKDSAAKNKRADAFGKRLATGKIGKGTGINSRGGGAEA